MARFDICRDPHGGTLFLDVQNDLIDGFVTRVVVPLVPAAAASTPAQVRGLQPKFEIEGQTYLFAAHLIMSVPASVVTEPIANASNRNDEITRALDLLFSGV